MARKHEEFTDVQKAAIYKIDRATCCFTGANLWLLDAPFRVGWESDWIDHSRPISRGGKAKDDNGVCASSTFNMKKRNNSADTTYLFRYGHPTALYFELFGEPDTPVTNRLQRLAMLEEPDWYFNRAITWVFEALNYQWAKPGYKRTDEYWFKAAHKKLVAFRKIRGKCASLEERGIITNPSETQGILLSIRECVTPKSMQKKALQLSSQYSRNSKIWWEYFHPDFYEDNPEKHDARRRKAYEKACKIQDQLTHDTFSCIQADHKIRYGSV